MKILVVGGGGREHALVWKLKQSPLVEKIWCLPGNGGIRGDAECIPGDPGDVEGVVRIAEKLHPDLTVVGPELPLVNGIADVFLEKGWPIVGPSKRAAQLEGSKIFSKQFLERHAIPTARSYGWFDSAPTAIRVLGDVTWPVVLKADGLCAGKGVLVASDPRSAEEFIHRVLDLGELGEGGKRLLLEEGLRGEELSFILLTDGTRFAPLAPTRDYKRVFDGDKGPNTGGMGAYSTDSLLPEPLRETILETIILPSLKGLADDQIPYSGFLYAGLMLTTEGPRVLEFNCRLGDPETQAIVARMEFDLAKVLLDTATGRLNPADLAWKPEASVCVVLASAGYPGRIESGKSISYLTYENNNDGVVVFHAGTRLDGGLLRTSGGRVLGVTACDTTLDAAAKRAYQAIDQIRFDGMHYRKDIGIGQGRIHAAGE